MHSDEVGNVSKEWSCQWEDVKPCKAKAAIRWNWPSHYWGVLRFPSDTWPTLHPLAILWWPPILYVRERNVDLYCTGISLDVFNCVYTDSNFVHVGNCLWRSAHLLLTLCGKVKTQGRGTRQTWRSLIKQTKHYFWVGTEGDLCICHLPKEPLWHFESPLYLLYRQDDFVDMHMTANLYVLLQPQLNNMYCFIFIRHTNNMHFSADTHGGLLPYSGCANRCWRGLS